MNISMGLNKIWRVAELFVLIDGNMLNADLPDCVNVMSLCMFRYLPFKRKSAL
jgi:hypothetical protein